MILNLEHPHHQCCAQLHDQAIAACESEKVRKQFDELTRPLIQHLLGHARSILHSEDLAWDAVQEALLGLWKKVQRGAAVLDYAGPWLCRAVELCSLQIARQNGRRSRHEQKAAACRSDSVPCHTQHDGVEVDELRRILDVAISALPDEYRRVLELRTRRGLDYATVAQELGIPVGTVRSRLNRARLMLQQILSRAICHETFENGQFWSSPAFAERN